MAAVGEPAELVSVPAWLEAFVELVGQRDGLTLGQDEQDALLDIARIAAHTSERKAAPLSTFVAGVAFAGLRGDERVAAIRSLADRLEAAYPDG